MKYNALIYKENHLLGLLFIAFSSVGILHHELWLDEAHHWLLARDSESITNLIENTRYEGHPLLWNLLLYIITRFSSDPIWMQLLHITLSSSAVIVFLRYAPINRIIKVLFIFGYFMFFEYNLLSRNYALGVLFLFLACTTYKHRESRFLSLSFLLVLTSNTHAIFLIIACAMMLALGIEQFSLTRFKIPKRTLLGFLVFFMGLILALYQIIPPSDTSFFDRLENIPWYERLAKSVVHVFKGFIVLPDFRTLFFWNSNLMVNISKPITSVMGILSLSIPWLLFQNNKYTLIYSYIAILGGILFFYVTYINGTRYDGLFLIALVSALWISHYNTTEKDVTKFKFPNPNLKNGILYGILSIQFFAGIIAYTKDFKYPFSNSRNTVEYLDKKGLSYKTIASKFCDGTTISSYLKKKVFFLKNNEFCSYCTWNRKRTFNSTFSKKNAILSFKELIETQNQSIVFISFDPYLSFKDKNVWYPMGENLQYRFLKKFDENILKKGSYYIYEIAAIP